MSIWERISLAVNALADRAFVASHTVTQEAILKSSPEEQQAIAESFSKGSPIYFYEIKKEYKQRNSDDSSD